MRRSMKTLLRWSVLASSFICLLYLLLTVVSSQNHCNKDDGSHCDTQDENLYWPSHGLEEKKSVNAVWLHYSFHFIVCCTSVIFL